MVSIPMALVTFPLVIFTFLVLWIDLRTFPVFTQLRPGRKSKPFTIYKLKSMNDNRDENGKLLPDDVRLTKIGKIVRSLSLDELPQLYNVIRGEMSLIGPRPLLMEYLPLYSDKQSRRHEVRPGITGWAQVNGRNQLSWEDKFDFDVWYVDNQSFLLDLKIVFLTIKKVIFREGISSANTFTMEKFRGTK